ncbi:MAG: SpaA isopeptide-forming pilin-related protein, partial [Candidatus Limnocylindrales bacterium]
MSSRGTAVRVAGARRGLTLTWLVLFIASILLQYGALIRPAGVLAATSFQAGTVAGFEIDGNLLAGDASTNPGGLSAAVVDGGLPMANGVDWKNPTPAGAVIIDDLYNSDSDVWFKFGKELDTTNWQYQTTKVTPGKDDMKHVMAYAKFVGSNAYFYSGAERVITNGTTHMTFELNRKALKVWSDGVSKPNRSVGDLLIGMNFSNGGTQPEVEVHTVTKVTNAADGSGQVVTVSTDLSNPTAIHSAVNLVDMPDQGFGYAQSAFTFAELAIDLHAIGIDPSCPGFASGNVRTRSGGDLLSSDLKDTSAPFPINLDNCGKLRIEKHAGTTDGPLLGGATFTVAGDPTPGSSANLLTVTDNGTGDSNPTAGIIDIDPAVPGTYTVCETVPPAGYKLPSPACQTGVVISANGSATVKFGDPRKTATTTLAVVGADPANGSNVTAGQSISLTVTETNTGESVLHGIAVSGTNSCATWTAAASKNNGAGAFSGSLNPGESVNFTCTFSAPDAPDFSWSATATGLDELNAQHDPTGETVRGRYDILEPATTLSLQQDAAAQVHEGDLVTIVVRETNTGEGRITDVHVDGTGQCLGDWTASATKVGGSAFDGWLSETEAVDFTCSFNAPAADFAWGADGKGTDALGNAVPAAGEHQDGSVDVVSPATMLTLQSASTKIQAGDTATIVVRETNTGDGPLTNVHVVAGGDCTAFTPANVTTLAKGAYQDFTCTITTTAGDGTDLAWTADGKGTDALGASAPGAGEHQEGTVEVIAPATTLELVSGDTQALHGTSVTITVVETNTGDDTLSNVNVTGVNSCANWVAAASKNNGDGAFSGSLAPGESVNFSCTFTVGTTDVSWSALAHGTDSLQAAAPATNEDEAGNIDVINPATTLTLVSEVPDPVLANGSATITVRETNTGDSSLSNVNVTGSPCATWTPVDAGFDGTLDPTESEDFTCTIADVGTTNVAWSALGHGTDELDNAAPLDNEDEAGSIHVVNPNIDVVKTAGSDLDTQAADGSVYSVEDGTTVVYRYEVTTQDPDGLTNVTVSDDLCSPVTAVETAGHNSGDTNTNDTLEPGETWVFTCSTDLSIADDGATVHNIATATGTPLTGADVNDQDDADVALLTPGIQIIKTAGDAADGEVYVAEAGTDNVVYHYSITNTGEIDLLNVDVVDDHGTPGDTSDDIAVCTIPSLEVGATETCEVTLTVTVTTTNVAVATGHTAGHPNDGVSDDDDAVVRIPGVGIDKSNDDTDGVVGHGQTVTYTIDVSVFQGPLTNAVVTDTLPAGQTYVPGSENSVPAATSFEVLDGGRTLRWTWASLSEGATITYDVTIDGDASTGSQTNVATICVSELAECKPSDS